MAFTIYRLILRRNAAGSLAASSCKRTSSMATIAWFDMTSLHFVPMFSPPYAGI